MRRAVPEAFPRGLPLPGRDNLQIVKRIRAVALLTPLAIAAACGKEPPSAQRLARAATDSARQALPAAFRPPRDGLVTDAQLDRYIRVRRAAKGRSDGQAARAVGVDPDELAWVRERVTEALLEVDRRRVRAASDEVYTRTIASLRETRRGIRDAATARSVDEQIAGLEKERASVRRPETVAPAVAGNARKIAARRTEIDGPP